MEYNFTLNKKDYKIRVNNEKNASLITLESKSYKTEIVSIEPNYIELLIDNRKLFAHIALKNGTYYISIDGVPFTIDDQDLKEPEQSFASSHALGSGEKEVKAPMPGKVIKIFVKDGDKVERGSKIAILEAMKMENELTSPIAGKIAKVLVKEGNLVDSGQKIVEIAQSLVIQT